VTFVLVHGLFHGAWCWRRVVDPLRAAGHRVYPLTLTGLGERAHLLSDRVSLDTFVADVIGVLESEELTDVILVGHSFGAVPVLGVADAMPERLLHLILIDGLLPVPGRSLFDVLPPDVVADRRRRALEFSAGMSLPPVPAAVFGITDPDDIAWVDRRLAPHPLRTYSDPFEIRHPLGNGLPCSYLACTDPPYAPLATSHERARARTDWSWHELPTGHDVMIIAPDLLLDQLLNLTCGVTSQDRPATGSPHCQPSGNAH
jgi:pimeloyl-ACP methyl ester carboxylesterase